MTRGAKMYVDELISTENCGVKLGNRELAEYIKMSQTESLSNLVLTKSYDARKKHDGKGISVAIINSGCDIDHPQFAGRIKESKELKTGLTGDHDPEDYRDEHVHGTPVCGIIAGKHTGIARAADIYIVKIHHPLNIAEAVKICTDSGINIINLSVGHSEETPYLPESCEYAAKKGVILVAAAGNKREGKIFPAAYDCIISVGAVDGNCSHHEESNVDDTVDICAPGVDIFSLATAEHTLTPWRRRLSKIVPFMDKYKNAYCLNSGTSFATPHVTGAIALALGVLEQEGVSVGPKGLNPKDMIDVLKGTAAKPELDLELLAKRRKSLVYAEGLSDQQLYDCMYGAGLLDAARFLEGVKEL